MTDTNIEVSVVMGSESDLPTMQNAIDTLSKFNINQEIKIVSAHRTPHEMVKYAESANGRGIKVIIAGAGGAAHLPGMIAAVTTLPVIGVPIPLKQLDGIDSLLSIVQMPRGVPVATVAIGNAENAALLAIRILAIKNSELESELVNYQSTLKNKVDEMNENIKNNH
ncbi:MAG: 5-(carboxyamino)imidazole ribonucleotide mutase [Chloroflexi bacterium]|mgnify:FL=1|nr:5-(carboxyamino)imidazole ribonucleotide mutase [Chloroflexota bacterium]